MKGRRILVTGASRGIGESIALHLASLGADLALMAREEKNLSGVARAASERGVRVVSIGADMADGDSVEGAVERARETLGGLDGVVANAGITADQLTMRLKPEDWDRVLAVNLTGTFRLVRAAMSPMIRARYGRIVLISSVAGLMGNPGQAAYAASKAGLIGLAKSVAREIASRAITVNVVAPGLIETDMARALPEERRAQLASQIPMGRLGTPQEVAAVVGFLLSEEAGYITGTVLNVSGGLYM